MSPTPARTESTATTYWSLGAFFWSWTCTTSSFRLASFSSFCVATTLPITFPISIASPSSVLPERVDLVGGDDLVEEAPAQLLADLYAHVRPAGRAAALVHPQQHGAVLQP